MNPAIEALIGGHDGERRCPFEKSFVWSFGCTAVKSPSFHGFAFVLNINTGLAHFKTTFTLSNVSVAIVCGIEPTAPEPIQINSALIFHGAEKVCRFRMTERPTLVCILKGQKFFAHHCFAENIQRGCTLAYCSEPNWNYLLLSLPTSGRMVLLSPFAYGNNSRSRTSALVACQIVLAHGQEPKNVFKPSSIQVHWRSSLLMIIDKSYVHVQSRQSCPTFFGSEYVPVRIRGPPLKTNHRYPCLR